jgi:hypothetical protein
MTRPWARKHGFANNAFELDVANARSSQLPPFSINRGASTYDKHTGCIQKRLLFTSSNAFPMYTLLIPNDTDQRIINTMEPGMGSFLRRLNSFWGGVGWGGGCLHKIYSDVQTVVVDGARETWKFEYGGILHICMDFITLYCGFRFSSHSWSSIEERWMGVSLQLSFTAWSSVEKRWIMAYQTWRDGRNNTGNIFGNSGFFLVWFLMLRSRIQDRRMVTSFRLNRRCTPLVKLSRSRLDWCARHRNSKKSGPDVILK